MKKVITLLSLPIAIFLISLALHDHLLMESTHFAHVMVSVKITGLFLAFYLTFLLIILKPFVGSQLYTFGLLNTSSLFPELIYILYSVFSPDFITPSARDKMVYLYILNRIFFLLAIYLVSFKERIRAFLLTVLTSLLSILFSFWIVLYYEHLPELHLHTADLLSLRNTIELFLFFAFLLIAYYIHRKKSFGEEKSPYISYGLYLHAMYSPFVIFYTEFYDGLIVVATTMAYIGKFLIKWGVFKVGLLDIAVRIFKDAWNIANYFRNAKPVRIDNIFYIPLGEYLNNHYFIEDITVYSTKHKEPIAYIFGNLTHPFPEINLDIVINTLKAYSQKEMILQHMCFYMEGNYIMVIRLKRSVSDPISKLHLMNVQNLLLNFLLVYIRSEELLEQKSRELERLYLLLEASEYVLEAQNNIDTFSKQVIDRIDYILKADGSIFFMWNKNTDLVEKLVFSDIFLKNFSDYNYRNLVEYVLKAKDNFGKLKECIYSKFEYENYVVCLITCKKEGDFNEGEFLFLKSVGNQLFHVVKLMKVIEDLKREKEKVIFLTEYDSLTLTLNRSSILKRLKSLLLHYNKNGNLVSLILAELYNLDSINSMYGYMAGNMLIKHVANLLKKHLEHRSLLGRYSGDEFLIILPNTTKEEAFYIAEKLKSLIEESPIFIQNSVIRAAIKQVVATLPEDGTDVDDVLSTMEWIIKNSKEFAKGTVVKIQDKDQEEYKKAKAFERAIFESIHNLEVYPYLQEIVSVKDGTLLGYEVLMRLKVGDKLLPASEFIAFAEKHGYLGKLDLELVRKTIQSIKGDVLLFFNLSPLDINREHVNALITLVNGKRVVFELTEREAVLNMVELIELIKRMKEKGIMFAIDDLGSGFSSFLYLKHIPCDFIKIDGEFVKSILNSDVDRLFVESVVKIAKAIGVKTIAEFVENEEILKVLREIGVDYAQGYYIGKPAPIEEKIKYSE
ncbi:EAL domain-containing protein [Thermocrinis minervae]|uniref:Diguanylate cyclase (GGDEF) domain-containing protein n=1 Tax=Thermocrinis minervae TaxID=381751 RepID=A0A1M6SFI4_9AQUI|nr:bifunctional diguanylate cyclase/phosphodiesterase [Thermocrinis minervae]SHK43450.1 diguanylate cyclase (GGDEF) domain-containing protein [Thermocrinis minervae]